MQRALFLVDGARILAIRHETFGNQIERVWDLRSGERVADQEGHQVNTSRSKAYSSDGTRAVMIVYDRTGSSGRTAHVCDAHNDEQFAYLEGHGASIEGVGFLPGREHVVTVSEDRTVRFWDASNGELLVCIVLDAGATALGLGHDAFGVGDRLGQLHLFTSYNRRF